MVDEFWARTGLPEKREAMDDCAQRVEGKLRRTSRTTEDIGRWLVLFRAGLAADADLEGWGTNQQAQVFLDREGWGNETFVMIRGIFETQIKELS